MGAAREALERRLTATLGTHALIYEMAVAPIRKRTPLVASVRVLQALTAVIVIGLVAAGGVIAFDDQPLGVKVGFSLLTATTLVSAALSYRDMLRSGAVASDALVFSKDHDNQDSQSSEAHNPQLLSHQVVTGVRRPLR